MKSLSSSIRGDPVFMQRVNGWLTIFWIAMIPISIATGWISSVAYVASLSLWALVSGHWSAWQAARVEVAQKKEEERRAAEDIAGEVIDRVVRRPTWRSRDRRDSTTANHPKCNSQSTNFSSHGSALTEAISGRPRTVAPEGWAEFIRLGEEK